MLSWAGTVEAQINRKQDTRQAKRQDDRKFEEANRGTLERRCLFATLCRTRSAKIRGYWGGFELIDFQRVVLLVALLVAISND